MRDSDLNLTARRWDDEYRQGRYDREPPLPFVDVITTSLKTHRAAGGGPGLYVGCGNGRNYLPLVDTGLDLYGLDVSAEALRQLAARRPAQASRLICDDFRRFRWSERFHYVIAIQVFQHGTSADAAAYFGRVAALLKPGGFFFLRVNSASTDVYYRHTVVERSDGDGLTVQYLEGPKQGLAVHFYGGMELQRLTQADFRAVAEPRENVTRRSAPKTGSWAQWEAIWERRTRGPAFVGQGASP
ncbi:MAG: class I SAM-dependent DNA methyltransferase [Candidatus Rokuibacteriota bacterium]